MNIPKLSISQPVLITMLVAALVVVGFLGYTRLPVDLLPDVSFPVVAITTVDPGASAEDVETSITKPIEEAVSSLNGVRNVTSTSRENLSQILVEFSLDTNPQTAAQNVQEKINAIRSTFPTEARSPTVQRFDFAALPIMTLGIADTTGKMNPGDLRRFVDDTVVPSLERTSGVAQVNVSGGLVREIQVQLNLDALRARHLSPQQVSNAIAQANASLTGGTVTQDGKDLLLRTPGQFKTLDQIGNVVIEAPGKVPVRVGDVATVVDGNADVDTYSRLNGNDSVAINILKQSGSNTVAVANGVREEIATLQRQYPNISLVVASDQSEFIRSSVQDSLTDLILGGLFAALVVLFFFRDVRNTIVTVVGLPVIMIGTFAVMQLLGLTLNIVTLLALSLAVGLVIDDAIVVRENIFRHMERGEDPKTAALNGTTQVGLAVLAMTLTVVSVFLPIAFVGGLIGKFFSPFGLAVTAAVLLSLVEAFTLAPMLSAHWFKQMQPKAGHDHVEGAAAQLGWLDRLYRRALGWTLAHRLATAGLGAVAFLAIVACVPFLQLNFFPSTGSDTFQISMKMPAGTTLDATDAAARQVESTLRSLPETLDVLTTVGGQGTPENASFTVKIKDSSALARLEPQLRQTMVNVPGFVFSSGGFGGGGNDISNRQIQINLQTTGSTNDLIAASQQIMDAIKDVPGLVDLDRSYQPGKPELHVTVDGTRAATLGLSTTTVGATIRTLVNGDTVSRYQDPGREADIVVRLRPEDRARLSDILGLSLTTTTGQSVPLQSIASIDNASGPTALERLNRQPKITVGANILGRAQQSVVGDIQKRLNRLQLPAGVTVNFGGEVQQFNESFSALIISLLLSVLFVYMILASQFGSFTQPLVMMLALPLSLLGAFLALLLTGLPFDLTAMIGVIMLFGLVTKNSILLIDFANRLRRQGLSTDEALLRAGPIRLRPVLMTSFSLILGSLPVALGLGTGGSFRQPLALVVIGGLITSTILTLLLVPTAYSLLDLLIVRARRAPAQAQAAPTPAE